MKIYQLTTGDKAGTFEVLHDGMVFSNGHRTEAEAQTVIDDTVAKAAEDVAEAKAVLIECEEWLHGVTFN